jgi:hypothetical protein
MLTYIVFHSSCQLYTIHHTCWLLVSWDNKWKCSLIIPKMSISRRKRALSKLKNFVLPSKCMLSLNVVTWLLEVPVDIKIIWSTHIQMLSPKYSCLYLFPWQCSTLCIDVLLVEQIFQDCDNRLMRCHMSLLLNSGKQYFPVLWTRGRSQMHRKILSQNKLKK